MFDVHVYEYIYRMHAQALTLAVLSGSAAVHCVDFDSVLEDEGASSVDAHEQFEPISNW